MKKRILITFLLALILIMLTSCIFSFNKTIRVYNKTSSDIVLTISRNENSSSYEIAQGEYRDISIMASGNVTVTAEGVYLNNYKRTIDFWSDEEISNIWYIYSNIGICFIKNSTTETLSNVYIGDIQKYKIFPVQFDSELDSSDNSDIAAGETKAARVIDRESYLYFQRLEEGRKVYYKTKSYVFKSVTDNVRAGINCSCTISDLSSDSIEKMEEWEVSLLTSAT